MFINYTNHPSNNWSQEQKRAAGQYGKIIDFRFPDISVLDTEEDLDRLAAKEGERILAALGNETSAVLCQGEFTFTYRMVNYLRQAAGDGRQLVLLGAVSEREVQEVYQNGETRKQVVFKFKGFRRFF